MWNIKHYHIKNPKSFRANIMLNLLSISSRAHAKRMGSTKKGQSNHANLKKVWYKNLNFMVTTWDAVRILEERPINRRSSKVSPRVSRMKDISFIQGFHLSSFIQHWFLNPVLWLIDILLWQLYYLLWLIKLTAA